MNCNFQTVFNSKIKAVFFDMDGVLFDSMPRHAASWVKAFACENLVFTEYEAYLAEGRTGSGTIHDMYKRQRNQLPTNDDIQRIYKNKSAFFEQYGEPLRMQYAIEVLEKVKSLGLKVFLVTGSGQKSLLNTLENYFPNYFTTDNMVTAYDVKKGKPDPEPYLMALKKSGINSDEALVIENAPLGVMSAVGAEIFTIAVNTGILDIKELLNAGANVVFDSMCELFKFIDN